MRSISIVLAPCLAAAKAAAPRKVHKVVCPNCGGNLVLRLGEETEMIVCEYCTSQIDVSSDKYKVLRKMNRAGPKDKTIKVGMKCVVEIPARATELYDGEVILVSKQGQDENDGLDGYTRDFVGKSGRQTFDVEVKLLAHDPDLRPDFRARVRFILGAETEALVVPWGAIKRRGARNTVMVVEDSRLVERVVQLGASDDTAVDIVFQRIKTFTQVKGMPHVGDSFACLKKLLHRAVQTGYGSHHFLGIRSLG